MAPKKTKADERYRDIAQNRRALFEYAITDRFEAGIVLQGSEVKGIRESGATISDAYVQIRIIDVRMFARFEDITGQNASEVVGRTMLGPRIVYGVKWHFWN